MLITISYGSHTDKYKSTDYIYTLTIYYRMQKSTIQCCMSVTTNIICLSQSSSTSSINPYYPFTADPVKALHFAILV